MTPDQAVFNEHLQLARYVLGESEGQWKLERMTWPYAYFSFPAKRPDGTLDQYSVRFELSNYPQQAPAGSLWDMAENRLLSPHLWPAGQLIGAVFNPGWKQDALYLPCDRTAQQGHDAWKSQHSELWWTPSKTILVYLSELFDLLNRRDYEGPTTR